MTTSTNSSITYAEPSLLYLEVERFMLDQTLEPGQQLALLYRLYNEVYIDLCKEQKLPFTNLYSRMAYIEHRLQLPRWLASGLHQFRIFYRQEKPVAEEIPKVIQQGILSLAKLVAEVSNEDVPDNLSQFFPKKREVLWLSEKKTTYFDSIRVSVLAIDHIAKSLELASSSFPGQSLNIQYNTEALKASEEIIDQLGEIIPLPATLQLLKVNYNGVDQLTAKVIILEPDYLIDISGIAESFSPFAIEPDLGIMKKYLPFSSGLPLLVGNIANAFLDELLIDPNLAFNVLAKKIFHLQPLSLALMSDEEVLELVYKVKQHYATLQMIIKEGFPKYEIKASECILEPTFFSSDHGLQGRLDLFYPDSDKPAMIELKSGKIYRPNNYGLARNHYTQTLLYDLLIKFCYRGNLKPTNYILYSQAGESPLRFAPPAFAQQAQAMHVRNRIVFNEYKLCQLGKSPETLQGNFLDEISPAHYPKVKGFQQKDIAKFYQQLSSAGNLIRKYFFSYTSFIAREQMMAKVGQHGASGRAGQSALWLQTLSEKLERFEILPDLILAINESDSEEPLLFFDRPEGETLSNFRKGDICVLYPNPALNQSPLHHQLFKVTLISIDAKRICLRLRYRQFNKLVFENFDIWRIEHDIMDASYLNLHKSIYAFLGAPARFQQIMLGLEPPRKPLGLPNLLPILELSKQQHTVLRKALAAEDYFLLWGPPGTGKTSVMLRNLVQQLLLHKESNIMLLAYTNRAVDEMCEALENIKGNIRDLYLRIGSRYSTNEKFREQLLQINLLDITRRSELVAFFEKKRIVVSTVSSVASRPELFKLKRFDTVIIDEASQILEPMLVGLLSRFKKTIMIGDHQQLPAVVLQSQEDSAVNDEDLKNIGIHNLRDSLFERLYKKARASGWDWAYDRLNEQGRLHKKLMRFSNDFFYEGFLDLIPRNLAGSNRQEAELPFTWGEADTSLTEQLVTDRALFFDTPVDLNSISGKTNIHEAEKISTIVQNLFDIYQTHNRKIEAETIGIITPYRSQIACIQQHLEKANIDYSNITIDTVERYQGGARDIILISLCTNHRRQLEQLINESSDGIDRKLNVAITRAREQIIITGNERILGENKLYRALMDWAERDGV